MLQRAVVLIQLHGGEEIIVFNMHARPEQRRGNTAVLTYPAIHSLDDLYRDVAGQLFWKKLRELRMTLERAGVRFSVLDPDRLDTELTSLYLDVKRRQAL